MSCRRVKGNLIQQNCYIRDVVPPRDVRTVYCDKTYSVLETVQEGNSVRDEVKVKPYPITPEYVNSFADSCDISRDLGCLQTNVRHGDQNLGDVREIQKMSKMSLSEIHSMIEHLQQVVAEKKSEGLDTSVPIGSKDPPVTNADSSDSEVK